MISVRERRQWEELVSQYERQTFYGFGDQMDELLRIVRRLLAELDAIERRG